MLKSFSDLPADSRLWIFASDRELTGADAETIRTTMTEFLTGWKAHGAAVEAGFEVQHDRFLLIASSDAMADPSGCSIDDMTRNVRQLGEKLGINFMPGAQVFYRTNGKVESADRPTFKQLAKQGAINGGTTVYNTMVTSMTDLTAGKWELPAGESWHKQLLG